MDSNSDNQEHVQLIFSSIQEFFCSSFLLFVMVGVGNDMTLVLGVCFCCVGNVVLKIECQR